MNRVELFSVFQLFAFTLIFSQYYPVLVSCTETTLELDTSESERLSFQEFLQIAKELPENDPKIIKYIQKNHLIKPTTQKLVNKLKKDPSACSKVLSSAFKNHRDGFFVEAGANDGVYRSNTLRLEKELNWTGLLIEPSPVIQKKFKKCKRNVWKADVCTSLSNTVEELPFKRSPRKIRYWRGLGVITHSNFTPINKYSKNEYVGHVPCFPIFSLMSAINRTVIDFFSLDVEGAELMVLKTIPFEKLLIKTILVEFDDNPEGKEPLITFLTSKGFVLLKLLKGDAFFVNSDYMNEIEEPIPKQFRRREDLSKFFHL